MATTTPNWTDNVSILSMQTLARNATVRGTIDLRTKIKANAFIRLARGGTAALTNGVVVRCRRTIDNGGTWHVGDQVTFYSQTVAANSTTCAASGNNAGVSSLAVASTTGFAAGDIIFVDDSSTSREWLRVARVTDSTTLLLDDVTKFAHNNIAHTVRNKADQYVAELEGGALWEVVVDYGDDSAGDTVTIEVLAQRLDSYTVA